MLCLYNAALIKERKVVLCFFAFKSFSKTIDRFRYFYVSMCLWVDCSLIYFKISFFIIIIFLFTKSSVLRPFFWRLCDLLFSCLYCITYYGTQHDVLAKRISLFHVLHKLPLFLKITRHFAEHGSEKTLNYNKLI